MVLNLNFIYQVEVVTPRGDWACEIILFNHRSLHL